MSFRIKLFLQVCFAYRSIHHAQYKEPETYSSVLNSIQEIAKKKKASALLPLMRTMTKYLHKADTQLLEATTGYIL